MILKTSLPFFLFLCPKFKILWIPYFTFQVLHCW